jgi:hypothetical protein
MMSINDGVGMGGCAQFINRHFWCLCSQQKFVVYFPSQDKEGFLSYQRVDIDCP